MSEPVASLDNALVVRGGFPLLSGVTLEMAPATMSVVTGANGAGKTTLLRLLGGLEALSGGAGRVCGVDLARENRRALRRRVGWLGHDGSFYDDLSVRENLTFAAKAMGRPVEQIEAVLARAGIEGREDVLVRALSAGQRRRVGLAWLLLRRPELWLLDEPYAAIDVAGRDFLDELFHEVVAAGATVAVSAHDQLRSLPAGTRTWHMVGGRIESIS
ncbi:MAG TPA: heme ABC exporter ATP-binding protein CcmA [Acidimicrobiales bacterium]|nr:heme ABC exporter ATP-binding protein CcmA [Acidimicrobiales bacterium]